MSNYPNINRRKFIRISGAAVPAVLASAGKVWSREPVRPRPAPVPLRNADPRKALVLWYSQTGHTARIGRLIARTLEGEGLSVTSGPLSGFAPARVVGYDLLVFGTPVFYMDVPANVRRWLSALPDSAGAAAASWVTYGGAGDNFFNTACGVLEAAAEKGAAPVGLECFGNMSAFAPTWSALGLKEKILKYRHLPDEETYDKGRRYARALLQNMREQKVLKIEREFSLSGAMTVINPMWWTKRMINRHGIDLARCTRCGNCARACPVGAIGPDKERVDRGACLACFGCINNCPADAVVMEYLGRPVSGWPRFCRENGIVIAEPREPAPEQS